MNKFFGRVRIPSEKNGEIDIHYILGQTFLFVDNYHQSTHYISIMWRKALRHVPKSFEARKVLMLGLGGGSAVREIARRFSGCEITVVEWDPQMIALYHEIHSNDKPITIIEADASVAVPAMTEKFDLVLVDLFKGNVTPPELAGHEMVQAIADVLSPNGFCLLNAFVSPQLVPVFDQHFTRQEMWKYQFNTLVLYRSVIIGE